MNHRHRKTLHSLFQHPLSGNVDFKQVQAVLQELGASIETRAKARVAVTLNGHTAAFHAAGHEMPKDEVVQVRHFLEKCGIDPAQYPL